LIDEERFEPILETGYGDACERILERGSNAVCLGISIMTGFQIKMALALAKTFKQKFPDTPIVWGGYHASSLVEETLRSDYVDIVVSGYGEVTFKELVDALVQGRSLSGIEGISYKDAGRVVHNPKREIPTMAQMPPLPYHLVDTQAYIKKDTLQSLPYISSRGCPYACGFCSDYVVYERKWNPRPAEDVVRELVAIERTYAPKAVRVVDSNFFVNERRVIDICEGLIKEGVTMSFVKVNGDAVSLSKYADSTIALMRRANFVNILIAPESGYPNALHCISKSATLDQAEYVSHRLRTAGISVGHSYMAGYPYDLPLADMAQEHRVELAETLKSVYRLTRQRFPDDYFLMFFFTPYPGTRLYPRYIELGFKPPKDLEGWANINLNDHVAPWISKKTFSLIKDAQRTVYFFSGKSERLWRINQAYRFARLLPSASYEALVKKCDRAITTWLYRRLERGYVALPFLLRCLYFFEMSFLYGKTQENPGNFRDTVGTLFKRIRKKVLRVR
jgi:radical SAM superfamily enzyme YgiQ (UPF0313 family)